jgi:hypothetical protein
MTDPLLVIFWVGVLAIGSVVLVRDVSRRHWQRSLVAYALRLPRGLTADDVAAFLTACTGMRASSSQRPFVVRAVALEVVATEEGIIHHLLVPAAFADVVLAALRAAVPGVVAGRDEMYRPHWVTGAVEVGQSGWRRPLATGQAARVSATLLASLQPLEHGERIVVQWILAPTAPAMPPVVDQGQARRGGPLLAQIFWRLASAPAVDAATAKQIRAKQASALYVATGRIGAVAATRKRAEHLCSRALAPLHAANAPGAHLHRA